MEDIVFEEGQLSKLLLFDERASTLEYPKRHNVLRVRTALREACGGLWHVEPTPSTRTKSKKRGAGKAFLAKLVKDGGSSNKQGKESQRTDTAEETSKRLWRKIRGVAHVTGAFKQEGKKRLLRRRLLGKFGPQHENDARVAYLRAKYGVQSALAQAELLPASLKELQGAKSSESKSSSGRNLRKRGKERRRRWHFAQRRA